MTDSHLPTSFLISDSGQVRPTLTVTASCNILEVDIMYIRDDVAVTSIIILSDVTVNYKTTCSRSSTD